MSKPYNYYIYWNTHNVGYFGYREANMLPAEKDLWNIYKTSSKYVKEFAEKHGDPTTMLFWEEKQGNIVKEKELSFFKRLSGDVRENYMLNESFHHAPPSRKGKSSPTKGKTWEEIYGKDKAEELRQKKKEQMVGKIKKPHSKETKMKQSLAGKARTDNKMSKSNETRIKMSIAAKARWKNQDK